MRRLSRLGSIRAASSTGRSLRAPNADDVAHFRSVLSHPDDSVLSNVRSSTNADLSQYNVDWTRRYIGYSPLVLRPASTAEISSILSYCHTHRIGVVPQGGNTSLCGGATPVRQEVILSLERLHRILSLDQHTGILHCEAGCLLHTLQSFAADRGFLFPLDIGSKGSCQIGGNVSTNAGGQYYFRFGSLHATVMGLEVVLPEGTVLSLNIDEEESDNYNNNNDHYSCRTSCHRKDNTGYDLKHLFLGAEGTLGVITRIAIACQALLTSKNVVLLVCDSFPKVLKVLQVAKETLGEILSAVELMDGHTLQCVRENRAHSCQDETMLLDELLHAADCNDQNVTNLSSPPSGMCLLVETLGSNLDHDKDKIDTFVTSVTESDMVCQGWLAQNSQQMNHMWNIRESCNPSVAKIGYVYKFDVSLPIAQFFEVALEIQQKLEIQKSDKEASLPNATVCLWGHVVDGNAHINIVTRDIFQKIPAMETLVETIVYDAVRKRKGSISAEHGIGQSKRDRVGQIKPKAVLEMMQKLKFIFDPHGIMNPKKYLPSTNK